MRIRITAAGVYLGATPAAVGSEHDVSHDAGHALERLGRAEVIEVPVAGGAPVQVEVPPTADAGVPVDATPNRMIESAPSRVARGRRRSS